MKLFLKLAVIGLSIGFMRPVFAGGILCEAEACTVTAEFTDAVVQQIVNIPQINHLTLNDVPNAALIQLPKLSDTITALEINSTSVINISYVNQLKNLKTLKLKNIASVSLARLDKLNDLAHLEIDNAKHATDFSFLSKLTQLETLTLSHIPPNVGKLPSLKPLQNLKKLVLNVVKLQDLSSLEELDNLKELQLLEVIAHDFSFIGQLTKLERLILGKAQFTDYSVLSKLSQLRTFQADEASGFTDLSLLPRENLSVLELQNHRKISHWSALKDLKNLTEVSVSYTNFSDLSTLSNANKLIMLNIDGCTVTHFDAIKKLPELAVISLSNTQGADEHLTGFLNPDINIIQ